MFVVELDWVCSSLLGTPLFIVASVIMVTRISMGTEISTEQCGPNFAYMRYEMEYCSNTLNSCS